MTIPKIGIFIRYMLPIRTAPKVTVSSINDISIEYKIHFIKVLSVINILDHPTVSLPLLFALFQYLLYWIKM